MATLENSLIQIAPAADATTDNGNPHQVIGRKSDAAVFAPSIIASIIAYLKGIITEVVEIERHLHTIEEWYGYATGNISRGAFATFQIACGNAAYGTETVMYSGTGLAGASFDFNQLQVDAVGTAGRTCFIEWYETIKSAGIAATTQNTGDTITKNSHGLANGAKIMLTILTGSTGLNASTVYYVVNQAANTFQVSLTLGGAAVAITVDGTVQYHTISQTLMTEKFIKRTATSPDTYTTPLQSNKALTTSTITARGKANGGTNTVNIYIGLHTYPV